MIAFEASKTNVVAHRCAAIAILGVYICQIGVWEVCAAQKKTKVMRNVVWGFSPFLHVVTKVLGSVGGVVCDKEGVRDGNELV